MMSSIGLNLLIMLFIGFVNFLGAFRVVQTTQISIVKS